MNPVLLMLVGLVTAAIAFLLWGLYLAVGHHLDYFTIEGPGRWDDSNPRHDALILGEIMWTLVGVIIGLIVVGWIVTTVGGLFL